MNITNHSNINEKCNEVENDNNNKIPDLDSNINSTASQQINSDRLNINKTSFEELKSSKNRVIKDNKGQISHKTKGHKSNSLRKKRFAPAVYNYVTNHDVDSNEKLEPEGVVNTANLANFNIKTTHEPYKSDALRDTYIKHKPQHIPVEESASDELKDLSSINERGSQEKDERPESEESLSREIGKGKESSERSDESKTDSFQNHLLNSKEKSSSENLNNDVKKSLPFLHNSDESFINDSNESKENIKNLEPLAIKDNDNRDSYETSENSNSDENFKQEHGAANLKNQDGSNTEQSIKTENDAYNQSNFTQNYKKPIDKYIDESTEQISKESVSTENEFDNANSKIFDKNDSYENSPIDSNIHSNDTTSTNLKTIVNINDGEIKPVIEQNTEDISIETSEELKSSDLKVENPQEKNVGDVENKKVDLKQQFERIPLDYKHVEAESNEHTESPESNNDSFVEKPKEVVAEPSPENVNFDENLNIKFGDISIKLPEIKLPDDILSYNYEEPLYEKVKSKNSYSHEEPDSQRKTYHKNNNNYDYHNNYKENYKHKDASHSGEKEEENDDDDEDLYEKFVRERFGKRRSKEENKSKYITPNEELYKTLQNVLKKTEKIQEEAQKSGDPNAGYAWTLEYGQKL
ncbi:myb-like protein D [Zerene cesonia]|uniref:myb-like protein D n=1 Tax=Zerene cesonia TaxID=33412 RepID=UPI0018E51337|nr:myb-like protein D [Zerene cesonia]